MAITSKQGLTINQRYTVTDATNGTYDGTYKGSNYDTEIRENVLYFWSDNGSIPVDSSDFIQAIQH